MEGGVSVRWDIGVASTFTSEALGRFTKFNRTGFPDVVSHYHFAPYDQVERACRDRLSVFGDRQLSAILLLWRIEDIAESMFRSTRGDYKAIAEGVLEKVAALNHAISALANDFDGTVIASLPAMPRLPGISAELPLKSEAIEELFLTCRSMLRKTERSSSTVKLLDLDALVREVGAVHAFDDRKWYLYRQPYAENFLRTIAQHTHRLIGAGSIASKKCIVIDCDNTIWGGVVSEDGLGGLGLGESFPGRAFVDIQREILALKNRGIFVAVASKNDIEAVMEVFSEHDGMLLKPSDISVFEVNWGAKSDSLLRIATKLNIGVDSLVLLDDNPAEIAEVSSNLPGVSTILLPTELTEAAATIRRSHFFDTWRLTREDQLRETSVAMEEQRQSLRLKLSPEEYLSSLDIQVGFFDIGEMHLDRVSQLINKTNQFNLTTKRRTLAEVRELLRSDRYRLFAYEVRDKFGEYGLVGVIITRQTETIADIDTWLMSCRVLNRGVEDAVVVALREELTKDGVSLLRGHYLPTAKNGMVANLLSERGFTSVGNHWELDLTGPPPTMPKHLRVHGKLEEDAA
jgi:FkbH-like protein